MPAIAALVATVVLGALAVLQIALALGAPLGRFAWGGKHRVLPRGLRIGSAVSVLLYAVMAFVLLARSGAITVSGGSFATVAVWAMLAYFVLGTIMNAASRSPHERLVMTPTCALLAACTLVVALG